MTNEKWWWSVYMSRHWNGKDDEEATIAYDTLEKIVAEAERRGEVKAWEEANKCITALTDYFDCEAGWAHEIEIKELINAKLTSLKKV